MSVEYQLGFESLHVQNVAVKVRKRARSRQRLKTPVKKFDGHGRRARKKN
jgi:hypothetical protein